MKILSVVILSFVVLISACSDDPEKQSQSDPKAPANNEATSETTKPIQAAEAPKPEQMAKAPTPTTNTPQPTLAESVPKPVSDSENCVVDPVTGRVVCSTGLCALFNDLCPPGTPMGMAKIPFEIGYNIATSFGSGALTVAKTGLEKTDAGTVVVEKVSKVGTAVSKEFSNALYQIRKAIKALLADPPEEFNAVGKPNNDSSQVMNKPKVAYQATK